MNLSEIYDRKSLGETNDYYPNNKTVISSDIEGKPGRVKLEVRHKPPN